MPRKPTPKPLVKSKGRGKKAAVDALMPAIEELDEMASQSKGEWRNDKSFAGPLDNEDDDDEEDDTGAEFVAKAKTRKRRDG